MNNLPERWMLKVTPENIEIINKWRKGKGRNEDLGVHNRYSYVLWDGWGTNNEPNASCMKVNYAEITFDQFKKFVLKEEDLSELPESWCVKNDGSQSFLSTVIPYLNNIKKNKHSLYDGTHYGGYYGINHPEQDMKDWSGTKPWGTILTLDQFIILTTQPPMKKEITEVPVIYGSGHHLQAFLEDCVKLGYKKSELCKIANNTICLKLNRNKDEDLLTEDGFKIIAAITYDSSYCGCTKKIKRFNLPQDWISALDFMKENMEIWKELSEKPKFKVGDWVMSGKNNISSKDYQNKIGKVLSVIDGNSHPYEIQYGMARIWSKVERLATPEEIAQAQVKIFKMTSSSGDFELEVSKKGIYYKPEDNWPITSGNWKTIKDANYSSLRSTNGVNSYDVRLSKLDIGCKKDCLIDQWIEVYDYYNSIKD